MNDTLVFSCAAPLSMHDWGVTRIQGVATLKYKSQICSNKCICIQKSRRRPSSTRVRVGVDSMDDKAGLVHVHTTSSRMVKTSAMHEPRSKEYQGNDEEASRVASQQDSLAVALDLLKRQLAMAVSREDFALAASLKTQMSSVEQRLSPKKILLVESMDVIGDYVQAILVHRGQGKGEGRVPKDMTPDAGPVPNEERVARAVHILGELGDKEALPSLAQLLMPYNEKRTTEFQEELKRVGEAAEAAMWSVFMKGPSSVVDDLMSSGMRLLQGTNDARALEDAYDVYTEVIRIAPEFAEGFNKRATVLYLQKQYQKSVDDCVVVLKKNPYHFGAATGMGMCYMALGELESSLESFELAMKINPRLSHLQSYVTRLSDMINSSR